MKNKLITAITIIIIFILFCAEEIYRLNSNVVLKIVEPTIFQIDLNGNRKTDDNETICIPEITSYTSDIKKDRHEFSFKNKVSDRDLMALGYLAEEFASKTLLNKDVDLHFTGEKNGACRFANIEINGQDYAKTLVDKGFAIKDNTPLNLPEYEKQLANAKKLDFVILNHKNNKYHSPDCKYAKAASDAVVILRKQLSDKAVPCKVCLAQNAANTVNEILKPVPTIISDGNIKIFLTDFTRQLKPDKSCISSVCQTLVKNINETNNNIDIAAYGWESVPAVDGALSDAKKRGVKIRLVTDAKIPQDNHYPDNNKLISFSDEYSTDFNSESKMKTNYLMHNKFMIFDNKKVYTGSMNFSRTGLSGFNANSVIIIDSPVIAKLYKNEFEQMLHGKFHKDKSRTTENENMQINGTKLSVFFSPQDKTIRNNIIPLVNNASKYIYIPTFVLTHQELSQALINAKNRGVDIKIIIDGTNSNQKHTKHHILRDAGIKIKTENYAGKMHMKTMIIDDKYTITGSMNFSNSGENRNDENLIIIENRSLAEFNKDFFNYLWIKIPEKYLYTDIRAESPDSIGSCSDGVDNDHDGKIDNLDEGCKP